MDLESTIITATRDVFETMVMQEASPGGTLPDRTPISYNLSGLLGIAGDIRGSLSLHWPLPVAMDITGCLLGEEKDYPEEDVADAIAEIVNMVAGGIKTAFAQEDKVLELSVPSTVTGRSFSVRSSRSTAHIVI